MTRRRLLLTLAMLLLVGGLALVPGVRWPVYGWLRGEAFYQGMPSSWWSCEIKRFATRPEMTDLALLTLEPMRVARTPSWFETVRAWSGWPSPSETDPVVLKGGHNALPVLTELLVDPDRMVREQAVGSLGSALMSRAVDEDYRQSGAVLVRQALHDPAISVRVLAAYYLLWNGDEISAVLARLTEGLTAEPLPVRFLAAQALSGLGPKARDAVPALLEALKVETPDRQPFLLDVLANIDPEAAAKAGVK